MRKVVRQSRAVFSYKTPKVLWCNFGWGFHHHTAAVSVMVHVLGFVYRHCFFFLLQSAKLPLLFIFTSLRCLRVSRLVNWIFLGLAQWWVSLEEAYVSNLVGSPVVSHQWAERKTFFADSSHCSSKKKEIRFFSASSGKVFVGRQQQGYIPLGHKELELQPSTTKVKNIHGCKPSVPPLVFLLASRWYSGSQNANTTVASNA